MRNQRTHKEQVAFPYHIDVEAGFQSSKSTIAETGMGVTSRP